MVSSPNRTADEVGQTGLAGFGRAEQLLDPSGTLSASCRMNSGNRDQDKEEGTVGLVVPPPLLRVWRRFAAEAKSDQKRLPDFFGK